MPDASAFSPDYIAARARFRAAALAVGAELETHPIGLKGTSGEDLTIEVARLGNATARRVVCVSSGLHGVEGFLGAAIQSSLLEEGLGAWRPGPDGALLLLFGLNPWGMAHFRRVNEDNVDLNRNFLRPDDMWRGAPEGFAKVERLLHPKGPRSRVDSFLPRAVVFAARNGTAALHAPAAGQYDRPRGLFFGGNGPSRAAVVIREQVPRWLGRAREVLHLDLHSGVGARGQVVLLSHHREGSTAFQRLEHAFREVDLLPGGEGEGVRGAWLPWVRDQLPSVHYDGLTAEFGTVGPLALLGAMREENRSWHYDEPGSATFVRAQERLVQALIPGSKRWRDRVVPIGVRLVQRALQAGLGAVGGPAEAASVG
jgi:hypothetical protein